MERRNIGPLSVSALGLGCMGMAGTAGQAAMYGPVDRAEAIATIHHALDLGINFFDTAEIYGPFANEELVAEALAGRRHQAVIATKFGFAIDNGRVAGVNSQPSHIRDVCEASLKRLNTDVIDLFYQHRVDPAVPIEDVVGTLAELVKEGKIRAIGLSECSAATLRRACAIAPIAAVQSEWSLWERDVEADIAPTARELGVTFVPYSPLGRGFLTGSVPRAEDLPDGDYRKSDPRYQGTNYDANMAAVATVKAIAAAHAASPAQVAIAWLLAKGPDVVPIPGCKRRATLIDTAGAATLTLSGADITALDTALPHTAGLRYGNKAALAMTRL
ncbi:aldo/keto reductase [Sandarakinorhabdus sp. AAP62]|uniref:aldo/keto reductase n=1 Tax=Sandarakinorhabdus sp. AAP62 TaxID=1248916 RepID=UPI0002DF6C20|nr:aldo/keto reductase [Sandarakinorhabdus sp. AAP62]